MKAPLILTNSVVVTRNDSFLGTVSIDADRITSVDTGVSRLPAAEDLQGDFLVPGFVELHTDCLEKHLAPRPGVRWPVLAALVSHDAELAAGGITTAYDGISLGDLEGSDPVRNKDGPELVEQITRAQELGVLRAEHRIHLRCEVGSSALMRLFEPLRGCKAVGLVSVMDHTPGQRQWHDLAKYREYNMKKKGWTSEQVDRLISEGRKTSEKYAATQRQELAAYCVEQAIPMASHDDTTAQHVAQAYAEGIRISEFPTTESAAKEAKSMGMCTVMGAPNIVRGGSHSGNVSAAELAQKGLLDILSSDYVASSLGLAAFRLVTDGLMQLPQAIATVSLNPARAVGLNDRGEIAQELRADVVRVRVVAGVPVVRSVWRGGRRIL